MDLSISNFILQGQMRKQHGALKSEATITLKEDDPKDPDSFARALKPVLMEAIQDVLDELETVYDNISKMAKDHIHPEYVYPPSTLRENYMKKLLARSFSPSATQKQWKRSSSLQGTIGTTLSLSPKQAPRRYRQVL